MIVLYNKGEIDFRSRDSALLIMFSAHIWCYVFEYAVVLIDICKWDLGIVKSTIIFINASAYQGAVFYAQVKYISASYDEEKEPT